MSNLFVGGSASLFLIIIGVFIFLQFVCAGGALDFSHIRRCQYQHLQSGRYAAAPGTAR